MQTRQDKLDGDVPTSGQEPAQDAPESLERGEFLIHSVHFIDRIKTPAQTQYWLKLVEILLADEFQDQVALDCTKFIQSTHIVETHLRVGLPMHCSHVSLVSLGMMPIVGGVQSEVYGLQEFNNPTGQIYWIGKRATHFQHPVKFIGIPHTPETQRMTPDERLQFILRA